MSHTLVVTLKPGMMPLERHAIEDALEAALAGAGHVTGGGTAVDLSESDIDVEVHDVDVALPVLREALRKLRVPQGTVIQRLEPELVVHRVYDAEGR